MKVADFPETTFLFGSYLIFLFANKIDNVQLDFVIVFFFSIDAFNCNFTGNAYSLKMINASKLLQVRSNFYFFPFLK